MTEQVGTRSLARCRGFACALAMTLIALTPLGACASAAAAQIPCGYEIAATFAGPPGPFGSGASTFATAISPDGRWVVGFFMPGGLGSDRAFAYDVPAAEFRVLPLIPDTFTNFATDVNDAGFVTGRIGGLGGTWGFVFSLASGQYTLLPPIHPDGDCWTTGINSRNEVCGYRGISGSPNFLTTAFRWSEEKGFMDDLGLIDGLSTAASDINDSGVVCISSATGYANDPNSSAYLWNGKALIAVGSVPHGMNSVLGKINNAGWTLVGGLLQAQPIVFGSYIRRSDGVFLNLPPLAGGFSSGIRGITESGVVTGQTNWPPPNGQRRATVWYDASPVDLESLVQTPFSGFPESAIISDNEIIACNTELASGVSNVVVLLVPNRGIPGDTNCDAVVDHSDILEAVTHWGSCAGCHADLNRDASVNARDLIDIIIHWTAKGGGE